MRLRYWNCQAADRRILDRLSTLRKRRFAASRPIVRMDALV